LQTPLEDFPKTCYGRIYKAKPPYGYVIQGHSALVSF
jgi:hypothetical protein